MNKNSLTPGLDALASVHRLLGNLMRESVFRYGIKDPLTPIWATAWIQDLLNSDKSWNLVTSNDIESWRSKAFDLIDLENRWHKLPLEIRIEAEDEEAEKTDYLKCKCEWEDRPNHYFSMVLRAEAFRKAQFQSVIGQFTWNYGSHFFVETEYGNFVFFDPEYGGDNSLTPFNGGYMDWCLYENIPFGRDKGKKKLIDFIGSGNWDTLNFRF